MKKTIFLFLILVGLSFVSYSQMINTNKTICPLDKQEIFGIGKSETEITINQAMIYDSVEYTHLYKNDTLIYSCCLLPLKCNMCGQYVYKLFYFVNDVCVKTVYYYIEETSARNYYNWLGTETIYMKEVFNECVIYSVLTTQKDTK